MNRYNEELHKVEPAQSATYAITPAQAQQLDRMTQPVTPAVQVDTVFVPQATVRETATPVKRAIALTIRVLPFTVVWLVLAIGIVWKFQFDSADAFLIFAVLTAVTYYGLGGQEYQYSTNGLERHRIDMATHLASQKMAYDAQLRREITQAFLKQLGGPSRD